MMNHIIFIDNCTNTTFKIDNKVKSIILGKCTKVNLIFKNVVSTVELINCKSIEVYVMEGCPTVTVDKSENVHVVLPMNPSTDIVSSNAQGLNVTSRNADDDQEKDTPIPY